MNTIGTRTIRVSPRVTRTEIVFDVRDEIPPRPPVTLDMIEIPQVAPAPVTFWGFLLGVFNTIVGLAVTILGLAVLAVGAALCLAVGAVATVVWLIMGLVGLVWSGIENIAFRVKHGMAPSTWRKQNRPRAREFRV